MAKHKKAKDNSWMDDHDDAHFSGNPAYKEQKKGGVKRRVPSHSSSPAFNRIYGNKQQPPKKTSRHKVFVKQ